MLSLQGWIWAVAGLAIGCGSRCPEVARCPEASLTPGVTGTAIASGDPGTTKPSTTASTEQVFTGIYDQATWGTNTQGKGNSGTGSTIDSTIVYTTYLQRFMKEHGIKSVVDAGCGDWEFSSTIDWTGIHYKGYDIVASVIAADTKKYGTPTIQFFVGNILDPKLPAADLLVSKDVLQHLPNADVKVFLEQLPKYKHVLLTNGTDWTTLTADNLDIALGDYRVIDLTKAPFGVAGKKVLTYDDGKHTHQVLHIARPDLSPPH